MFVYVKYILSQAKTLLDISSESDGCETPGPDGSAYDPNYNCDSDDSTTSKAPDQPMDVEEHVNYVSIMDTKRRGYNFVS